MLVIKSSLCSTHCEHFKAVLHLTSNCVILYDLVEPNPSTTEERREMLQIIADNTLNYIQKVMTWGYEGSVIRLSFESLDDFWTA